MSIYELDPVCCDELVQTVYYPAVTLPLSCDALGCAPVSSPWLEPAFWDSPSTPPNLFAQMSVLVNWGAFVNVGGRCSVAAASGSVVSAASFTGPNVAPGSIATIFGNQLSPATQQATTLPLPTSLAGVSITLTDRAGGNFPVPLFYVSAQQINLQIPAGVQTGPASLVVNGNGIARATAKLQVDTTAAGIFTQNTDGKGVPAAFAVRLAPDGSMVSDPVFHCAAGPGSCQPKPIDLTGQAQTYLILYGTGIRNRRAITDVSVSVGGLSAQVTFAGAQEQFVGLDQVNVLLPKELAGRGTVDLTVSVNSVPANTVQLNFR